MLIKNLKIYTQSSRLKTLPCSNNFQKLSFIKCSLISKNILKRNFCSANFDKGSLVSVSFFDKDGNFLKKASEPVGTSILEMAHKNEVDLEGFSTKNK